ncbi:hypothetical protein MTR_3g077090 [Medicago truncatula]|uniref:Uncharacterized protein n=1 Tax=Medicago truncatula TaxID=3880 RepID=G7J4T0_MEDTR|nr:hypothetical protein MTR_3g077090 [Medicago truncatula]
MLVMMRRGQLCYGGGGGCVWWQTINNVRDDVGQVEEGWLINDTSREVGDGTSTLFWINMWIEGTSLKVTSNQLIELGVNGETWKWRMRLFVWEEELLGERVACISSVILQKAMGYMGLEFTWVQGRTPNLLSMRYKVGQGVVNPDQTNATQGKFEKSIGTESYLLAVQTKDGYSLYFPTINGKNFDVSTSLGTDQVFIFTIEA